MGTRIKTSGSLLAALLLAGGVLGMAPAVEREGDAAHIAALKELETKPFDTELFSSLSNWTHDRALDASGIEGKVVLLAMVSADNSQSMLTLSTLARYERQHGEDGLVALAIHPEMGWDAMSEKVNAGRVKVQAAMDSEGTFAKAMLTDNTPDLYLIDRAGQLRFADIENRSLKKAVAQLLLETPEDAIANAQKQAQGIEVIAQDEPKGKAEKKEIPTAAYANADWPAQNRGRLSALNMQGKPLPVALGNEEWLSKKKDIENKVIVLDFWATWCGPCKRASPTLEQMQRKYAGKVEILAIGGASDNEQNHRKYVIAHKKAYSNLYDKNDTINNALQVKGIPHTVIMSTDGVIRWQGNPLSPEFKTALGKVVESDPMFK